MDLQLTGKVAIVTGASKGVGLAVTRTLVAEGVDVVAVSRTRTPGLDELAGPGRLHHVAADLMDPSAPARVVAAASETFGGLDILVNNAGGPPPGVPLPRGSFMDASESDWAAMFEFNLFSVVRLIRAALPHVIERRGSIVNVSTVNTRQPSPMNVDYGAAKAALSNLTQALSEEYGPQGVRVNTVSPGPIRTAWWTEPGGAADRIAAMTGADAETVMDKLAPEMMRLTSGRLVEPQEVADVVAFVASPRSASTIGADFVVDGGLLKQV